jgi:hypothetical protein
MVVRVRRVVRLVQRAKILRLLVQRRTVAGPVLLMGMAARVVRVVVPGTLKARRRWGVRALRAKGLRGATRRKMMKMVLMVAAVVVRVVPRLVSQQVWV